MSSLISKLRIGKQYFMNPWLNQNIYRRERPGATVMNDGECDAEAFLAQGELEMKKGSDGKKCLHYLDKAVELNDYDEAAYVARSK